MYGFFQSPIKAILYKTAPFPLQHQQQQQNETAILSIATKKAIKWISV